MTDTLSLLATYSPVIYFAVGEKYLPVNPKLVFETSLYDPVHNSMVPAQTGSIPSGSVESPIVGKVTNINGIIYLDYWVFCSFNGSMGTVLRGGWPLKNDDVYWSWPPLANHNSDWEHICVQVDPSSMQVSHVFFSAHFSLGGSQTIPASMIQFENETHPKVWSALNSHAMYPAKINVVQEGKIFDLFVPWFVPVVTLGQYRTLQIVDITANSALPFPPIDSRSQVWRLASAAEASAKILDVSAAPAESWYQFNGKWGTLMDTKELQLPPPGVPFRHVLFAIVWVFLKLGLLNRFQRTQEPGIPTPFTRPEFLNPAVYFQK